MWSYILVDKAAPPEVKEEAVRYHERRYGQTNISRFRHGWLLLRMSGFAARKLKFI